MTSKFKLSIKIREHRMYRCKQEEEPNKRIKNVRIEIKQEQKFKYLVSVLAKDG